MLLIYSIVSGAGCATNRKHELPSDIGFVTTFAVAAIVSMLATVCVCCQLIGLTVTFGESWALDSEHRRTYTVWGLSDLIWSF